MWIIPACSLHTPWLRNLDLWLRNLATSLRTLAPWLLNLALWLRHLAPLWNLAHWAKFHSEAKLRNQRAKFRSQGAKICNEGAKFHHQGAKSRNHKEKCRNQVQPPGLTKPRSPTHFFVIAVAGWIGEEFPNTPGPQKTQNPQQYCFLLENKFILLCLCFL